MLSNINKILRIQSIIKPTSVWNNICKYSDSLKYNICKIIKLQSDCFELLKTTNNQVNLYNKTQKSCFSVLTNKQSKEHFSFVGNNVQKQNYSETENRRKMRKKFKCKDGYRIVEWNDVIPQLDCKPCAPKMTDAPRLKKPRKRYDDSKIELPKCPPLAAEKCAERLDDLIMKKKIMPLTKLNELGKTCEPCSSSANKDACPLKRLRPYYDASKMDRITCVENADEKCAPRMDEILGLKVERKQLKKLPSLSDKCIPCSTTAYKDLNIRRLRKIYDDTKMKYEVCAPPEKEICAERLDEITGAITKKSARRQLRKLVTPCCGKPLRKLVDGPRLQKPRKKYDDSKIELPKCPPPAVEKCAIRLDDLMKNTTIMPLTKLNELGKTCEPCSSSAKKDACPLKRPRPYYDASKMDRVICVEKAVEKCAPRMDEVLGLKVERKQLKKLPFLLDKCIPCSTTAYNDLNIRPLSKRYDDTQMKYEVCAPPEKEICAERLDEITGAITKKSARRQLRKLVTPCCGKPLRKLIDGPRLQKPRKKYDDSKMELPKCPPPAAEKCAVRLDDLIKKEKIMPLIKLKELGKTCEPCSSSTKKDACPLKRPRPYYDASKMDRVICVAKAVEKCAERLDDVTGILKEKHKKKVLVQLRDDCRPKPETKFKPVTMKRLPKYEPKDREPCPPDGVEDCDIDPPRLDDVLCWRPTKKILPKL